MLGLGGGTGPRGPSLGALGWLRPDAPRGRLSLALGVLEYRVLGTNFRDYAIVFTQLEAQEEAFSTVELYSECAGLLLQGCGPPPASHQPHPSQKPPPAPAPASRVPPPHAQPLPARVPAAGVIPPGGGGRGAACGEEPWAQRVRSPASAGSRGGVGWGGVGEAPHPPPSVPPGSPASPAGRTALASQEALGRFAKWSRSLGFLPQQQAELQRDCECRRTPGGCLLAWGPSWPWGVRPSSGGLQGVTCSLPSVRPVGWAGQAVCGAPGASGRGAGHPHHGPFPPQSPAHTRSSR